MASKNVFIVYAHPERKSLNGAILDATTEALRSRGHKVTVSDLYRMSFNPLLSRNDITGEPQNPDVFQWLYEISRAAGEDLVAEDIRSEQTKLDEADLVIFQFPLFWMGFPAILKGWFDRVMHPGYATEVPAKTFDLARFKGKRAMLSITAGGNEAAYSDRGIMGDVNVILWPLQNGVLRYVGYDVLAPHLVFRFESRSDAEEIIATWRHRLENVFAERPLFFHNLNDFENGKLKDDVVDKFKGQYAPTVGQHCGKCIKPGCQTSA